MSCCSCVKKRLDYMLSRPNITRKHDLIWIMEEAEKQIEEVEKKERSKHEFIGVRSVTEEEKKKLSFDPDYTQSCTTGGTCTCVTLKTCDGAVDCRNTANCTCSCPDPTKPNSSYVSTTCAVGAGSGCSCSGTPIKRCQTSTCTCNCTGLCYYACDPGYRWNAVTEQCELIPVPAKPLINMPLVNPVLVNVPLVRAFETMLLQSPLELQSADMFLSRTESLHFALQLSSN